MLSVAFSPDGKTVATLSDDKTVRRWETATGELRAALTHQGPVYSVAFSPDGKYLLLPSGNQAQFYLLRPADLV